MSEARLDSMQDPRSQPETKPVEKWTIIGAYSLCAVIWGTTWFAIRVCIGPGGYSVYPAAAIRFTISAILLAAIWRVNRKKVRAPNRSQIRWLSTAGVLSGMGYGFLYGAETHISGGLAGVISAVGPLVTAIIAMITLTEKPSKFTIAGSVIALAGVAVVFHDRLQVSPYQATAVALMLISCIFSSCASVVLKRVGQGMDVIASNTVFFLSSSFLLWAASTLSGQSFFPYPIPFAQTAALLYLTVFGTLIAFACWFYLLKHLRLSTCTTLSFLTPLIALAMDAMFEKHILFSTETKIGIAVVLIGVTATVWRRVRSG